MKFDIFAKEIYLENKIINNSYISVENGLITNIGNKQINDKLLNMKDYIVTAGFIDIHVHGGNGYDTMDGEMNSINEISLYKLKEGVTSFCPTTVTASMDKTFKAIDIVKNSIGKVEGAKIIGSFLEGPFINKAFKGAHPENFIKKPFLDEIKEIIEYGEGSIKSIALAPEINNIDEVINYLKSKNINIRIGHSGANYEETNLAVDKGCNIAIHVFNAMKPFTHREPGMVGAVLTNENIFGEVIVDNIHLHKGAVKLLIKCKGYEKTILITDCMNAGGMPDGDYKLGELDVVVQDKIARTLSGALAGSTLQISSALKNLLDMGISLFDAVHMATITPAKALGLEDKIGCIKVGNKADFVFIDETCNIKLVMIDGIKKYEN